MRGADFRTGFDWPDGYRDLALKVLDSKVPRDQVTGAFKLGIEHRSQFLFVHTNEMISYYFVGTL